MDAPPKKPVRDLIRRLVSPVAQFLPASFSAPRPEVLIHDPAAEGPKDLDDPFIEADAQRRIGEFIARSAGKSGLEKTN